MLLLLSLSLSVANACPAPFSVPGLRSARIVESADSRGLYIEIDTSEPARARGLIKNARIEESGYGLITVRGDQLAGEAVGDTLRLRCTKPRAAVYTPFRLGFITPPPTPDDDAWRSAERLWQAGDPAARALYETLKERKLKAHASLRLADEKLLAGDENGALADYQTLSQKVSRDVTVLARATRDEILLRRGAVRDFAWLAEDEPLSAEAAYRVARGLLLAGKRERAERVLDMPGGARVIDLRNRNLLTAMRADRVRDLYLRGDDLAVVRETLSAGVAALRLVTLHALFALDAADEVLVRCEKRDFERLPIAALAIDAELDLGRCRDARAHLARLEGDARLAPRLKSLSTCHPKEQP